MGTNRSAPGSTVIPVIACTDVQKSTEWICQAFGFRVRLRIANHRAQLHAADGAVILRERRGGPEKGEVMVRVSGIEEHYQRVTAFGAKVLRPLTRFEYGETQYAVEDPDGNVWVFSETYADVKPEDWGGESVDTSR